MAQNAFHVYIKLPRKSLCRHAVRDELAGFTTHDAL